MVDGEVIDDPEDEVETPEDDEETSNNTCSGWCRQTEKEQSGHVNLAIISDDQTEENVAAVRVDIHDADASAQKEDNYRDCS